MDNCKNMCRLFRICMLVIDLWKKIKCEEGFF